MKDWVAIVSRHLTTVLVIIALMWTIAKPHAEDFVRKTVDDRITRIEQKLDSLEGISRDILNRLDKIENRITRR